MKIIDLIKKAESAQEKCDTYCSKIVCQILKGYKRTREDYLEDDFVNSLACFIQAGDGMVLTDADGSNVPPTIIEDIIINQGFFTYKDFRESRI
ncbi:Uncharacterised protein [Chryseobacterium gleum]|uniref:Uncharacterized protein n=2 Tax=Chryseobacterium gleum TaxID=250 RepID=A0A448B838_CHRGE|nr:hypothetical protein [Chryseobacterium gleum]EFK36779.1 hypothetical protein HMPREF0204_11336 [Chryseobacterium gleum ATCC 35910]QQY32035.1 hypothetical protein I6I60_24935 [Chryseobacterium gleum]VEE10744.1 Uncharacterised protein [Chryseobacterium gleum]